MPDELEVKAVLPDAEALRARLLAAGAVTRFRGRMRDRRYDRAGELAARDEVLRVRRYHDAEGRVTAVLGWKGPATHSADGYKQRAEIELPIAAGADAGADALLTSLGYEVVHAIDREVEMYQLGQATVRVERYPKMDTLLEVEGEPAAIEQAIAASGIPRAEFTAEPLAEFVRRFEARVGEAAVLAEP
jgi:predicted adenylyl cyclase CyaB